MKTFYLFLYFLFMAGLGIAQNTSSSELPNIIPPSPTAYELGKYGQIDVGMFTGTPKVPISIYNYKTKNLSVPISLNYDSNGIKVDQMTTWVGLGWNLNAGGVITRIIRDLPDDKFSFYAPPRELTLTNQSDSDIIDYARTAVQDAVDTEKDLFSFNFNGYSGRFGINDNGIITSPFQALKIELTNSTFTSSSNFEITTPDGVKYLFASREKTNSTGGCAYSVGSTYETTAWYLTKITHPKGDIINFIYDTEIYSYELGVSQILTKNQNTLGGGCPGSQITCPDNSLNTCTNQMAYLGLRLKEINSNNPLNGKVIFTKGINNPDIGIGASTGNQFLLNEIMVQNAENLVLEKFTFNYLIAKKRVFLTEIHFLDASKFYTFEYFNPNGLPNRLSYSQDYWGYFNGKPNTVFYPKIIEEPLLASQGADREPNSNFAIFGLLKKINYPTKGATELQFEPNIIQKVGEIQYNSENLPFTIENTNTENFLFTTPNNLVSNQLGSIMLRIYEKTQSPCTGISNFYDDTPFNTIWMNVKLYDLTANSYVNFDNNSSLFQNNQPLVPKTVMFNFIANHQYRLELKKGNNCIYGTANVSYTTSSVSQQPIDVEIGGLRIKKTISKANPTSAQEIKRYYYGNRDNLNSSSANEGNRGYYINNKTVQILCASEHVTYPLDCNYYQVNSSSIEPLFNTNNNKVYYEYVTLSYGGDNFENGGEENQYLINRDQLGEVVFTHFGAHLPGINVFSNTGWNNGLLKKTVAFKKNASNSFVNLKKVEKFYTHDTRNYNKHINYKVSERHNLFTIPTGEYPVENINIIKYTDNYFWFYLSNIKTTDYDINGNNPIISTTNYFYDNPTHLQLTRTETTTSDNKTITIKTYYPDDVINTGSLGNDNLTTSEKTAIDILKTQHHIAEPIQVETTVKNASGSQLSKNVQRTNYRDWGNNQVLPEFVQTLKGNYSASNKLQDRLQYKSYYANGNPKELLKRGGSTITYIWGYQEQYPIAKIENATYAQIASQVTNLQNKSNLDNDRTIDQLVNGITTYIGNEGALRQALSNLRNSSILSNAQVTTFTYDPLIGVTSITDPRGETIYYHYDTFNRLEYIIDKNNKVISKNEYNYKN
ncbi:MAG TPA: RHS repeat protein [Flavobacteriia bacterium]|nr:RHS repeat protein [Flavobacteriia bacterium]